MERRKLFSENKVERRRLFSTPEPEKRDIKLFSDTAEEEAFQRIFSATKDEKELKLKEFSGRELSASEYAAAGFGELEIEKGFATKGENDTYTISPSAFPESRLFSSLTISVTKTLELDPVIMSEPKEAVIGRLGESGNFPPKAIMLLKKAHGVPFEEDRDRYLEDSGIRHDLPFEFGGRKMPRPEFSKIINERYEDAPTDIMEVLKNRGIIKVDGDNVEIIK